MQEEILSQLFNYTVQAVVLVLSIVAMNGMRYGISLLQAKLGSERYDTVRKYANSAVRYLDQADWLGLANSDKKERAVLWVGEFARQHNIPVSNGQIEMLIEECVQIMKSEVLPVFEANELFPELTNEAEG